MISRRIDLTKDRDFSSNNAGLTLKNFNHSVNIPWKNVFKYDLMQLPWKKNMEEYTTNECECCGRVIKNSPWDHVYCICASCADELKNNVKKSFIWKKEKEMISSRNCELFFNDYNGGIVSSRELRKPLFYKK